MKLLFCCESYWPHRGGVQEVVRQIAERMSGQRGMMSVWQRASIPIARRMFTMASASMPSTSPETLSTGIRGEADRYRRFLTDFDGDAILIKAAGNGASMRSGLWLIQIKVRKVFNAFVSYSSFYEPSFKNYFQLPDILRKFDHLIFYVDFTATSISPGPTGSRTSRSFRMAPASRVRTWNPPGRASSRGTRAPRYRPGLIDRRCADQCQGHETVASFSQADLGGRGATLILNGNWSVRPLRIGSSARAVLPAFRQPRDGTKGASTFVSAG